jgi:hypothetical protein
VHVNAKYDFLPTNAMIRINNFQDVGMDEKEKFAGVSFEQRVFDPCS